MMQRLLRHAKAGALVRICICIPLLAAAIELLAQGQQQQKADDGTTFYASPEGTPNGTGSKKKPWDLQTALSQPSIVQPGSTIYLRGGTYTGKFISSLKGTPGNYVTVRSFPGEWAVIDGYKTTTLNREIGSSVTTITLTDASGLPTNAGDVVAIFIDSEMVRLGNRSGNTFTSCIRGWGGTNAVSHFVGAPVVGFADAVTMNGSYTIFRDFEVTHSDGNRSYIGDLAENSPSVPYRGEGIAMFADHSKLINLVLHDNREGIGFWSQAIGSEVYGCIMFNNGYVDSVRGHGHGIYSQNTDPAGKTIREIITFNNYATGMKLYGESGGAAHYLVEGVISFNNGSPAVFAGNAAKLGSNSREADIFVGTTTAPMKDITVRQCYVYERPDTLGGGANAGYTSPHNTNGLWQDNYFLNGKRGFAISQWDSLTFQGNCVYSANTTGTRDNDTLISIERQGNPLSGYNFNHNTYYDNTTVETTCTQGARRRIPFADDRTNSNCNGNVGGPLDWNRWSTLGGPGWELGSAYFAGAPSENVTVVRPNVFDPNRANIVIMNWTHVKKVKIDLSSVLNNGDNYSLYAAEDYLGVPIASGTYSGGKVRIPCRVATVATPIGNPSGFTPASVRPEFVVIVLWKGVRPF